MKGVKGSSYTIKNRSNSAYKISTIGKALLTGTFDKDDEINISYNYSEKGVPVESVHFARNKVYTVENHFVRLNAYVQPFNAENKDLKMEVVSGNVRIDKDFHARPQELGESVIRVSSVSDPSKYDEMTIVSQAEEVYSDLMTLENEYLIYNEWIPIVFKFEPENSTDYLYGFFVERDGVEERDNNGRREVKVTDPNKTELTFELSSFHGNNIKDFPDVVLPVLKEEPKDEE